MTGENFIRLNRKRDTILEDKLQEARIKFTDYCGQRGQYYDMDSADFSFDIMNKLEENVKRLEYLVYCKNYYD